MIFNTSDIPSKEKSQFLLIWAKAQPCFSHFFQLFLLSLFLFKLLHILNLYTVLESRTKFIIIVSYRGIKQLCLCQCLLFQIQNLKLEGNSYCFLGLWNMKLKVGEEKILIIFNICLLIFLHLLNNTVLLKKTEIEKSWNKSSAIKCRDLISIQAGYSSYFFN